MNDDVGIPSRVLDVLLKIASSMGELGRPLATQASRAIPLASSPTYVDVFVPRDCERGVWADGPLRQKPVVVDRQGQPVGEILVWVVGGRVTLVEQAWFTDNPPDSWPPIEAVRVSSH